MPPGSSQQALINALMTTAKSVNLATAALHSAEQIVEKSYQNLHMYAGYSAGGIQAKVVEQIGDLNRKMRVSEATSTTMQEFVQASQRIKNAFEPINTGFINMTNKLSTVLLNFGAAALEKVTGVKPEDAERKNRQAMIRMGGMFGVGGEEEQEFRARQRRQAGGGIWRDAMEKILPAAGIKGNVRQRRQQMGVSGHAALAARQMVNEVQRTALAGIRQIVEGGERVKDRLFQGQLQLHPGLKAPLSNLFGGLKANLAEDPERDRMRGRLDFRRRQAEAFRKAAQQRMGAMTPAQRAAYRNSAQRLADSKMAMARKADEAKKNRLRQILASEKTRIPRAEIESRQKLINEFERQRRPLMARERRTMEGQRRRGEAVESPLSDREKTQLNILNDMIRRNQEEIDVRRQALGMPRGLMTDERGAKDNKLREDERSKKLDDVKNEIKTTNNNLDNRLKKMQNEGLNVKITNLNRWRLTPAGAFVPQILG